MAYVNSLFGNYGYIEVTAGETITGSFQMVKCRGLNLATITTINRQGASSSGLVLLPSEEVIAPMTSIEVTGGDVLVYLNAPNYSKS